ncbi:MAG: hypothetical protein PHQ43_12035, partial [Dehalococcoidales bacterium]|nr:hypothetical protein [Dehalococcoidales bacterium]
DPAFLFYAANILNLSRYFDEAMASGTLSSLKLSLNGLSSVNSTLQALYELSGKYTYNPNGGRATRDDAASFTLPFASLGMESTYHWPIGFEQETIATVHEAAAIKVQGKGQDNWDIVVFGTTETNTLAVRRGKTDVIADMKVLRTTPLESTSADNDPATEPVTSNTQPVLTFADTGRTIRFEPAQGTVTASLGDDIRVLTLRQYLQAVILPNAPNQEPLTMTFSEPFEAKDVATEDGRTAVTVNGTTVFISPFAEWDYPLLINGRFILVNSSSRKELREALGLTDDEAKALEEARNKTYLSKENIGFSSLEDFWTKLTKSFSTDADSRIAAIQSALDVRFTGVSLKSRLVLRQTRITDTDDPHPSPVSYMTSKHRIITANANTATRGELMVLLGVNEATAQMIIDERAKALYASREDFHVRLANEQLWASVSGAVTVSGIHKRDIYLGFDLNNLPPMDPHAIKMATHGFFWFIGGGSFFTSTMCNLLYKQYIDTLTGRKKDGLIRIFIVKNNADLESAGLTIERQMKALLRTLNVRFGTSLTLADLIDYIIIPDIAPMHAKHAREVRDDNARELIAKIKSGDPSAKMSKIPLDVQTYTQADIDYLQSQGLKVIKFRSLRDAFKDTRTGRISVKERMLIEDLVYLAERTHLLQAAGQPIDTTTVETLSEEEVYWSITDKDAIMAQSQGDAVTVTIRTHNNQAYTYSLNIPGLLQREPTDDMVRGRQWIAARYVAEFIYNRATVLDTVQVLINTTPDFYRIVSDILHTYISEDLHLTYREKEAVKLHPAPKAEAISVTVADTVTVAATDTEANALPIAHHITSMIIDAAFGAKIDTVTGVRGTLQQNLASEGIIRLARLTLSETMIDAEELETTLMKAIDAVATTLPKATNREQLLKSLESETEALAQRFAAIFEKYYGHFGITTYFIKDNNQVMLGKALGRTVAQRASKILSDKLGISIRIYTTDEFTLTEALARISASPKDYQDTFYANYSSRLADTAEELATILGAMAITVTLPKEIQRAVTDANEILSARASAVRINVPAVVAGRKMHPAGRPDPEFINNGETEADKELSEGSFKEAIRIYYNILNDATKLVPVEPYQKEAATSLNALSRLIWFRNIENFGPESNIHQEYGEEEELIVKEQQSIQDLILQSRRKLASAQEKY